MSKELEHAANLIVNADGLLICAGAGMGVDSGLPDFRGEEGFWNAYPALKTAGIGFQQIARPYAFLSNPEQAWGFYGHRLKLYRDTTPHDGYRILREMGEKLSHGAFVFTSNVDGHFQRAGFNRICELHGSIHHMQCIDGCEGGVWPVSFVPNVDEDQCRLVTPLPRCPACGGVARPNVLMFWDNAWLSHRTDRVRPQLESWLEGVENLVTIEVGAGKAIPTIRQFAQRQKGALIRINLHDPELPSYKTGVSLQMGGLEALQKIEAILARR